MRNFISIFTFVLTFNNSTLFANSQIEESVFSLNDKDSLTIIKSLESDAETIQHTRYNPQSLHITLLKNKQLFSVECRNSKCILTNSKNGNKFQTPAIDLNGNRLESGFFVSHIICAKYWIQTTESAFCTFEFGL